MVATDYGESGLVGFLAHRVRIETSSNLGGYDGFSGVDRVLGWNVLLAEADSIQLGDFSEQAASGCAPPHPTSQPLIPINQSRDQIERPTINQS